MLDDEGFESQKWDHLYDYNSLLYPGTMEPEDAQKLPKTCVFTSEFDFMRNDALNLIEKLKYAGTYLNHQDMPGVHHGY